MVDKSIIIKGFITNFIPKERRERSYLELTTPKRRATFIGRFNHEWDRVIDMAYLEKINKHIDYPSKIQQMLGFKDSDLCYVISHYDDFDDQILPFKDVFSHIYSKGLATLIINISATKFYLETEQVQGPPDRFIGKRIKK
jgi:hypothetical protein